MSNWTKVWLFVKSTFLTIGRHLLFTLMMTLPYLAIIGLLIIAGNIETIGDIVFGGVFVLFIIGVIALIIWFLVDIWKDINQEYKEQKTKRNIRQ